MSFLSKILGNAVEFEPSEAKSSLSNILIPNEDVVKSRLPQKSSNPTIDTAQNSRIALLQFEFCLI